VDESRNWEADVFRVFQLTTLLVACLALFSIGWNIQWRHLSMLARRLIVGLNATAFGFLLLRVNHVVNHPGEWDFLCYYLWSRLVGTDLPVYSPESSQTVLSGLQIPISPSPDFLSVIVQVGPNQTAPALLWYRLWIADRPFETAHLIWTIANVGFLCVCCLLLARTVNKNSPTLVLLLFPVVAFAPVTWIVLYLGQTAFVLTALIAVAWLHLEQARTGAFLAIGSLLKPVVGLVGLYFLIRRRPKAIMVAVGVGIGSLLSSGIFVGMDQVLQYFRADFVSRTPSWVFSEPVNQSLSAVVLREFAPPNSTSAPFLNPVFLGIASMLTLATVAIGWRAHATRDRLVFLHVLTLALLIYPGTLHFYSFLLFLPWLFLASEALGEGVPAFVLAIGFWGGLGLISFSAFAANLITWTALSTILVAGRSELTPGICFWRHPKQSFDPADVIDPT
jgi:hypothetical protein